jgi:hypothetical protein
MRLIPPELTTAILTAMSIASAWFATWLARRGKREDTKIQEANQAFSQLRELAEARLAEITRLTASLTAANSELDRIRDQWEKRWERQMKRCRDVTEPLVSAIAALRKLAGPAADEQAETVMRVLEAHNQDDHSL